MCVCVCVCVCDNDSYTTFAPIHFTGVFSFF